MDNSVITEMRRYYKKHGTTPAMVIFTECLNCDGDGYKVIFGGTEYERDEPCPVCNGMGLVWKFYPSEKED